MPLSLKADLVFTSFWPWFLKKSYVTCTRVIFSPSADAHVHRSWSRCQRLVSSRIRVVTNVSLVFSDTSFRRHLVSKKKDWMFTDGIPFFRLFSSTSLTTSPSLSLFVPIFFSLFHSHASLSFNIHLCFLYLLFVHCKSCVIFCTLQLGFQKTTYSVTQCSVKCGNGLQYRTVLCVERMSGNSSTECKEDLKPRHTRKCNKGKCHVTDFGKWNIFSKYLALY